VAYFELLLELKINMVELLEEVFEFMSAKRNENIKVISQVNRLTNKIEMEFSKMPDVDQGILKINQIIEL
jgi:histidyl-tRNA synthetase